VAVGIGLFGLAVLAGAAGYAMLAFVAVLIWHLRGSGTGRAHTLPPVTLLKPLCGAEPGLYENLRSFCQQDYPEFQIVFGVRDANDPALAVVARLAREFPTLAIDVVVNPQQHGSNRKVSNLINMLARARHDVLAIADSDAFVGPDYLKAITVPLLDRGVGLVTCIYRGVPTSGIWSRLGAMYINDWYMPSVLLAWLFGHGGYASGQTLCFRRDTLQALGGLRPIADHLADDYELGERVRGLGLRIVLSSYLLRAEHHEPTLDRLVGHEMRWMQTIRVLRPASFRFLFVTFSVPLAVLGAGLAVPETAFSSAAWAMLSCAIGARVMLHLLPWMRGDRSALKDLWLIPARDALVCMVWCRAFFTSRVTWRGSEFDVDEEGVMRSAS
jgi:ceramide glucosyltransferase